MLTALNCALLLLWSPYREDRIFIRIEINVQCSPHFHHFHHHQRRLGNAAIFLIGGGSRDQEPIPILLRSGDMVVMSGPQCRRAYHGMKQIQNLPCRLVL